MAETHRKMTDRAQLQPGETLKPFPSAEEIFLPQQMFLAKHLQPLVLVNLNAVNRAWSDLVPLSPLEPYAGVLEPTIKIGDAEPDTAKQANGYSNVAVTKSAGCGAAHAINDAVHEKDYFPR